MASLPRAFGRYRLLAHLDATETEVYRGSLPGLGGYEKPVVIRMLSEDDSARPDRVTAFIERARAAQAVQHPNAVPIFEVGATPAGVPFMVEGWVPGPSLAALAKKTRDVPWPAWLALHVAQEALEVLVHAAERGIAHPGLTADAVRLSYDGEIRVTGFGQRGSAAEHGAVKSLLLGEMSFDPFAADVPEPFRRWLTESPVVDLWTCRQWVRQARAAFRPQVTLVDVAAALLELEAAAAASSWSPTRSDPAPSPPRSSVGVAASATARLRPPRGAVARSQPSSLARPDAAPAAVEASVAGSIAGSVAGVVADRPRSASSRPRSALGAPVLAPPPASSRAGSGSGAPAAAPRKAPARSGSVSPPRSGMGAVRPLSSPAVALEAPTDFDGHLQVLLGGLAASEATTEPAEQAAPLIPEPTVVAPTGPLPSAADSLPQPSFPDWAEAVDRDRTDPRSAPAIDRLPTLEIHPGRRGDVRMWLSAPPAVVGPRRLPDGLRLVRGLRAAGGRLSVSVDGHRYRPLDRVAMQLGDPLPQPDPLDPRAPIQGFVNDANVLGVIGGRARERATGRLTFYRQEPDSADRVTLHIDDGHLVALAASAAPLAAWSRLLEDDDLPAGMASRAFAVVVADDLPVADVGSPLLNTALAQARAEEADRRLDEVLTWSWGRFAFVPGPALPLADRVTDVALLPRLFGWMLRHESASVLLGRLAPYLTRTMERAHDFDAVLSRLRLSPPLLEFAAGLGNGASPREAMARALSLRDEPKAISLTYLLVQLGLLIPA